MEEIFSLPVVLVEGKTKDFGGHFPRKIKKLQKHSKKSKFYSSRAFFFLQNCAKPLLSKMFPQTILSMELKNFFCVTCFICECLGKRVFHNPLYPLKAN